jgi:hypothetical protein
LESPMATKAEAEKAVRYWNSRNKWADLVTAEGLTAEGRKAAEQLVQFEPGRIQDAMTEALITQTSDAKSPPKFGDVLRILQTRRQDAGDATWLLSYAHGTVVRVAVKGINEPILGVIDNRGTPLIHVPIYDRNGHSCWHVIPGTKITSMALSTVKPDEAADARDRWAFGDADGKSGSGYPAHVLGERVKA